MLARRAASLSGLVPRLALRPRLPQIITQTAWRGLSTQADGSSSASDETISWPLRRLASQMPAAMKQAYGQQNMSRGELNQLSLQEAIAKYQRFPGDTGSGEVQVAVFTNRIQRMSSHMARNHKDSMTKRRLMMLILQRNRMLKYLRREQRSAYETVREGLSIRPNKNFDPTIKRKAAKYATPVHKQKKKKKKGIDINSPVRDRSYGTARNAKGRTRLKANAAYQRRLQRERDAALKAEKTAQKLAEQQRGAA